METNDIVTKDFEAFPDVAADILNALLYEGKQIVKETDLLRAPTETLYRGSGEKKNQLEDLAKYEFIDKELNVIYLFANQATVDSRMLIRKAGYTGGYYREQYDGKLPDTCPVIELVLYWGKGRWRGARSPRRMFGRKKVPEHAWKYIDDIKLHVWEMRHLPKEVRERFTSDMRIVVDYLAEGDSYRSNRKIVHKEALINMIKNLSGDVDFDETKLLMQQMEIKEENEVMACELFDQYVRKGREEGLLMALRSVLEKFGCSVEEAMDAVGIPQKDWDKFEKQLERS